MDEFDDNALIRAARKRILTELAANHQANIINNYGGGNSGGLTETMHGGAQEDPALYDYLVNIEKRDLPEMNQHGKPVGWTKKVRRFREPKGHYEGK